MRLKQRPEDFSVTESWRFDDDPAGAWRVYLMDKQKLTTFEAVDRLCRTFKIPRAEVTYCGLKDKQGRTTQLVAVKGRDVRVQDADLRLKPLGRSREPLSARNTTSNRFAVTVRDLSQDDVARLSTSLAEVQRLGVVNYFDSQRFGPLKHGQGFVVKELMRGDFETALKNVIAHPSELDERGRRQGEGLLEGPLGRLDGPQPAPGGRAVRGGAEVAQEAPERLPRRLPPHRAALAGAAGLHLPELALERGGAPVPPRRGGDPAAGGHPLPGRVAPLPARADRRRGPGP